MRPNLPFVSAKHTLVTYNITLSLITKTNQRPRCFHQRCGAADQPAHRANPARRGYRPTSRGGAVDQPAHRVTQQDDNRLSGGVDLVLSSHVDTMGHHRAKPRLWKWYQEVLIWQDVENVSLLTSRTGQPRP
jgi:hypothetical protein